jgi:hypothetical protein
MDEQLTALAKEVQDLRDRQLQDRHEAIVRDDAIFRRINLHDERMDVQAETLKKMIAAVGECADTITPGWASESTRWSLAWTDERWNQLIDEPAREHRNGGKKR